MDINARRKRYILTNAIKTAIGVVVAYIIGYVIGGMVGLNEMYEWMIITVIVVMSTQPNLGGAIDKGLMRLLGTFISAVAALIIIPFVSAMWIKVLYSLPIIVIATYVAGTSSKYSYAGTLAAMTAAIILLTDKSNLVVGMYRTFEIAIGIVIAICINRFIFSIRAETRLKNSFAKTVYQIRDLYDVLFNEHIEYHTHIMGDIFASFTKQLSFIKEMKYEHHPRKLIAFQRMNTHIRRLYRYTKVMYEYVELSLGNDYLEKLRDEPAFIEFKQYMIKVLTDVGGNIERRERINYRKTLDFDRYILPHLQSIESLNSKDGIFIFYSEMLLKSLEHLAIEYNYIVRISKH